MTYLVISSSLNPNSNSKVLALDFLSHLPKEEVEFIDLRDYPIPTCDGDKSYEDPNVKILQEKVAKANAIILASPIYNYYSSASAKNLIEMTGKAWEDKIVAFLCAAGGKNSYMSIMNLASSLMLDFRCVIVPRFVYAVRDDFSENQIINKDIQTRVKQLADAVVRFQESLG